MVAWRRPQPRGQAAAALIASLLLLSFATPPAPPPPESLLPCTPGLEITYQVTAGSPGAVRTATVSERVLGREGALCTLEQRIERAGPPPPPQRFRREYVPGRVLDAGNLETPLAFRPPLLVAPLSDGATWRFDGTQYRVAGPPRSFSTPAGRFEGCLQIEERAKRGGHQGRLRYCPGVGVVDKQIGAVRWRAVRVRRGPAR